MSEGEVAGDHLEEQVVDGVEDVGDSGRRLVGDEDLGVDALDAANARRNSRVGRVERWVLRLHAAVLLEHGEEPSVMGGRPVAPGPLTLFDDALDRAPRIRDVSDRDELGPDVGGAALVEVRPDEEPLLAQPVCQRGNPIFDGAVQVTLRAEVLPARLQFTGRHRRRRGTGGDEAVAVGHVHAFGPLEVYEVLERRLAEGQQAQLDPGGIALGLVRHVRSAHVGRRAHGYQEVLDQCPMEHLLRRDGEDHSAPPLHGLELVIGETGAGLRAQAEGGEEVLGHEAVLDFGRLAQQIGQLLAVLDDDVLLT